ncbi:MAG: cyanophycinase [Chloroflexota bacterium]|nr:cyanophycinase [Chloroflexota bacterium]
MSSKHGSLIIIGGHEAKQGDCPVLTEVVKHTRATRGRLVIVTVATETPEEVAAEYRAVFTKLGVPEIDVLDIRTRDQAAEETQVQRLADAPVIFFTGGDQLRITSQIGDSLLFRRMRDIYEQGGTIVGTSAGAAAMPETMLIGGAGDESHQISALSMAPGLGFISGVVIDSHFAERGRIGRLLGAVVQNPRNLGLGIDEDTAIIVQQETVFQVIGSGAMYVLNGAGISYSSLSEETPEGVVSMDDVTMHVLGAFDRFDLRTRRPLRREQERAAGA